MLNTKGGGMRRRKLEKFENLMQKFENLEDPPCQEVWNAEDDLRLRKSVRNEIIKNWELLKVCRDVIDENTPMVNSMSEIEKMKESLEWDE